MLNIKFDLKIKIESTYIKSGTNSNGGPMAMKTIPLNSIDDKITNSLPHNYLRQPKCVLCRCCFFFFYSCTFPFCATWILRSRIFQLIELLNINESTKVAEIAKTTRQEVLCIEPLDSLLIFNAGHQKRNLILISN